MNSLIPSRKELRNLLRPYESKNNFLAINLWIIDYSLFFAGQYLVITLPIILKIIGCIVSFIAMDRLFVLGHDASHSSLTTSNNLNYWLGQLAFLPLMVSFQGWKISHNIMHHGFTNLTAKMDVWSPLSQEDYNKLTKIQKSIYRIYRNSYGVFLYYFFEVWWKYLYFPSLKNSGHKKGDKFVIESLFISFFIAAWITCLYVQSYYTNQEFMPIIFFGFIIPFVLWNMTISFIVYLHHTHPNIHWYEEQHQWMTATPYITATVHIRFHEWISSCLHHIMEHPAHHLSMNIPCYNLKSAQRKLEELLPEHIVVQDFSWRWYLECTRICKLYDFQKSQWTPFSS